MGGTQMNLSYYISDIDCRLTGIDEPEKLEITDVACEISKVTEGCIFAAIKGRSKDGHKYAAEALEKGAAAVMVERDMGLSRQIITDCTRKGFAILCSKRFGEPSGKLCFIGVTGTNGKTSVAYMLKKVLESTGRKTGMLGTIKNEIGDVSERSVYTTPDPYKLNEMLDRMVKAGCVCAVAEASSQALDQYRMEGCVFKTAIFTNLTVDHLDYHNDIESYFEAKKKLFAMSAKAVICADDEYGIKLAQELGSKAVTYSIKNDEADFTAKNISCGIDGSSFIFVGKGQIERMRLPLIGRFAVSNAMAVAACCTELEISLEETAKGLLECDNVPGRAELLYNSDEFKIICDYAHTPDGLEKIITSLRECAPARVITLFGCGGDRDKSKRPLMGMNAARYSDYVVLTSDNPRTEAPGDIIEDVKKGFEGYNTPVKIIEDRAEAIKYAISLLGCGDILLLAGKGHEDYQDINGEKRYFSEKEIVESALQEMKV